MPACRPASIGLVYGVPAEISEYLIPHPVIRKISFTGSTVVGKQLAALAGQHMKRVTMELGGHAPVIVFDDADVAVAAKVMAASKFRNAGQVCVSPTRFLVQEGVYDEFVERSSTHTKALKVGNGLEQGIDDGRARQPAPHRRRWRRIVEDASKHGGKVRTGGHRIGNKGNFFEPTVVTELPQRRAGDERGAVRPAGDHQPVQDLRRRGRPRPTACRSASPPTPGRSSAKTANAIAAAVETGMITINHLGLGTARGAVRRRQGFGLRLRGRHRGDRALPEPEVRDPGRPLGAAHTAAATSPEPEMASGATSRRSDVRGVARLATDATTGLADLVEAMHERIARPPGSEPAAQPGRTRGITGLVYRNVRGVARVVGGSIDALLGLLGPALNPDRDPPRPPNAKREALVAALNGVLGDYLDATGNPLATPLALRSAGEALVLERAALARRLPEAGGRLLVLAHGLCMGDLQWRRRQHDHGAALARDLGYTPVYLHYNSGRHVSLNGRAFARALEQLVDQWPRPLERLVILGHSMGGLVARSALHCAGLEGLRWPARLDDLVFLGTPHRGSPLERAGHWVDVVLEATPYAAPFARLGQVRSAGITDLRHGNLVDEDWVGRDRFARRGGDRQHLPLPTDVRCHAVAATLAAKGSRARSLGDGLVPLASALGRHRDPARALHFAKDRQWIGHDMGHLDLLSHPEVYARLREWLA